MENMARLLTLSLFAGICALLTHYLLPGEIMTFFGHKVAIFDVMAIGALMSLLLPLIVAADMIIEWRSKRRAHRVGSDLHKVVANQTGEIVDANISSAHEFLPPTAIENRKR